MKLLDDLSFLKKFTTLNNLDVAGISSSSNAVVYELGSKASAGMLTRLTCNSSGSCPGPCSCPCPCPASGPCHCQRCLQVAHQLGVEVEVCAACLLGHIAGEILASKHVEEREITLHICLHICFYTFSLGFLSSVLQKPEKGAQRYTI